MILTVDVGNSNTVCIAYEGMCEVWRFRFETDASIETAYASFCHAFQTAEQTFETIVVSSVVPSISIPLKNALFDVYGVHAKFITSQSVLEFKSKLDDPNEIGADFIATAVAAYAKFKTACIIVDIGSATKITAVNETGVFEGGVIMPGIGISLQAMVDKIPHLPNVALQFPQSIIGRDTITAIQSGVLNGNLMTITGLSEAFEKALSTPCTKVLTGGYSVLFKERLPQFEWCDSLVNEGLLNLELEGRVKDD